MSETEQETPEAPDEAVEAAETDSEPEEGSEDEEEPESPQEPADAASQAPTDTEMEARFEKISRSFGTYKAAVERNLEEQVLDLVPCPMCFGTAHPAFLNRHDAGRVPREVQDAVMLFLGLAREQEYEQDPATETCPACNGKTQTKTGATAGEYIVRQCVRCGGRGFIEKGQVAPPAPVTNGIQGLIDSAVTPDNVNEDRDNWGEPRVLPDGTLNANFGRQPQYKVPHPVYGITANLTTLSAA